MASEQITKRVENQSAILKTLHFCGPLQRTTLSERLGIRKSSVTSIVSDLLATGLILQEKPGRLRSPLGLDHVRVHALCASVERHGVRFARVFLNGRVEQEAFHPCETALPEAVLTLLTAWFEAQGEGGVLCRGVALPGLVDPQRGVCIRAADLPEWHEVALSDLLEEKLGVKVMVDNDVRCQLWSCTWFDRLAGDVENVVYLLVHDGVACAIMTHGSLIVGERFAAGEIGHVRVGEEGRLCACGRSDCLEAYCSIPAVKRELASIRPDLVLGDAEDMARAAVDIPAIGHVLDRLAKRLARALGGLVAAVDPAVLVLGTSDRAFSNLLKPLLQRHLYNELIGLQSSRADILTVENVEKATLQGIAGLAIQRAFERGVMPG